MSHNKSAEILIVKASALNKQPQAFQDYVYQYFERGEVFGEECYYAFIVYGFGHSSHQGKGIAPASSQLLLKKINNEPTSERLFTWIKCQLLDPKQTDICRLSHSWYGKDTYLCNKN